MCTSPIIVYQSCCVPFPWGWDTEGQPLSLLLPVPLLCTSPVVFYFPEVGTTGTTSILICTSPIIVYRSHCLPFPWGWDHRDNLYPYLYQSHYCVPVPLSSISMRLGHRGTTSIPKFTCPIIVSQSSTLRASLSGTFLQTQPDLVMPLKGHSLSPRSCPPTWSVPSERFGFW